MHEVEGMDVTTLQCCVKFLYNCSCLSRIHFFCTFFFWDKFSWRCVYFIFINAELEDTDWGLKFNHIQFNLQPHVM